MPDLRTSETLTGAFVGWVSDHKVLTGLVLVGVALVMWGLISNPWYQAPGTTPLPLLYPKSWYWL
jgi:hypothetical protein